MSDDHLMPVLRVSEKFTRFTFQVTISGLLLTLSYHTSPRMSFEICFHHKYIRLQYILAPLRSSRYVCVRLQQLGTIASLKIWPPHCNIWVPLHLSSYDHHIAISRYHCSFQAMATKLLYLGTVSSCKM